MGTYFRDPRMFEGGPFLCFQCNKKLAVKIGGSHFHLELTCPRCKTYFLIKSKESIPFVQNTKQKQEDAVKVGGTD